MSYSNIYYALNVNERAKEGDWRHNSLCAETNAASRPTDVVIIVFINYHIKKTLKKGPRTHHLCSCVYNYNTLMPVSCQATHTLLITTYILKHSELLRIHKPLLNYFYNGSCYSVCCT